MNKGINVTRGLLGLLFLLQLILGVVFWAGGLKQLVSLHMALGGLFVLTLWILSIQVWAAGGAKPLALFAFFWGVVIAGIGYAQYQILPGANHWVTQVLHLLVAILGMGLAGMMTKSLKSRAPSSGAGVNPAGATMPRT